MIRTGRNIIHDFSTGKTYKKMVGYGAIFVYCDGEKISDEYSTDAVWDYLLSLVHTDLTKQAEEVTDNV